MFHPKYWTDEDYRSLCFEAQIQQVESQLNTLKISNILELLALFAYR